MNTPSFDLPDLVHHIEKLDLPLVDALPYGVIRLDVSGAVSFFSRTERKLSGYGDRPAIGKLFFADIAPCMAHVSDRLAEARARGQIDIEFVSIGDFADRDRELNVRVLSASDGGLWVFLQRPGR